MPLPSSYPETIAQLDRLIGFGKCFDIKQRTLNLSGRSATLYYATSMTSNQLLERLIAAYLAHPTDPSDTADSWSARSLPLGSLTLTDDLSQGAKEVRSGSSLLAVEGFDRLLITDTKMLPSRGINEPQHDQVLRGAREGFVENIIENIAILRRRLNSSDLHIEAIPVGDSAPTNLFLTFVEGRADGKYVENIRQKLQSIRVDALSLGQESLAECLIRRKWFNPFPKFRYTERPDAAAAMLLEGSILIFCDASPQAMILPVGIFDFLQETDDFYFPPLIGTYLRFLRVSVFFISLFLTPLWYLLIRNPQWIPAWLDFITVKENPGLPILIQILLVEFTIDWMKLASLNTPNMLGNSLSVVAGLILGDFAIQVGWLVPEVILYMAFVSMANFTQPSFELGYAFKFMRILLLMVTALLGAWGFILGLVGIVLLICLNKTVDGSRSYLYPLIPFNREVLFRQVFRVKLKQKRGKSKLPCKR